MLPLIGRIADLRGRLPVLVGALVVFALGSLVTAAAYDLPAMVVGRLLQGVGAGGLLPADARPGGRPLPAAPPRACRSAWSAPCRSSATSLGPVYGAVVLAFGELARHLLDQPRRRARAGRGASAGSGRSAPTSRSPRPPAGRLAGPRPGRCGARVPAAGDDPARAAAGGRHGRARLPAGRRRQPLAVTAGAGLLRAGAAAGAPVPDGTAGRCSTSGPGEASWRRSTCWVPSCSRWRSPG